MIDRDYFIFVMERIIAYREKWDVMVEALKPFGLGFVGSPSDDPDLEQILVDAIGTALNDTEDYISYFLYDRNGDLSKPCIWDENENYIDTSDWGKVYDLIMSGSSSKDKV